MLPAGSIAGALYHSLVLLRMGKIIARNMLSWLKVLIKLLLLHLFGCLYYGIVCCTVHAEITINGFYNIYKCKILEPFKYIDINIKLSS